jgi:hypothetical protein
MYACLRASISTSAMRSPRRRRSLTFAETLDAIRSFVVRHDKDDPLRGLICGIYWLTDGIAINIHQLRLLVPKCKSSINGSLQRLGFAFNLGRALSAHTIAGVFPILKDNPPALRKWTIRKRHSESIETSIAQTEIHGQEPPLFEISLEGLARVRPAEVETFRAEVMAESQLEMEDAVCAGDARWFPRRNDDLDSTVADYMWINTGRGE